MTPKPVAPATKSMVATFALAAALLLAVPPPTLAGPGKGEEGTVQAVKKEVVDAAEAIKAYSVEQRDEAVRQTKAALDDLDTGIERLEAKVREKWGAMDQSARDRAAAALHALKEERKRVAEWTGGLQHGSTETWDRVKQGFTKAYGELKAAWQKTEQALGAGE